jgi:hypothetical protein
MVICGKKTDSLYDAIQKSVEYLDSDSGGVNRGEEVREI